MSLATGWRHSRGGLRSPGGVSKERSTAVGADRRVDGAHDNAGRLILGEAAVAYFCGRTVQDEVDRTSQPVGGQITTEGAVVLPSPEESGDPERGFGVHGLELIGRHVAHCVVDAAREGGTEAEVRLKEASDAIMRLVRS